MSQTEFMAATAPFFAEQRGGKGPVLAALKPAEGSDAALSIARWLADRANVELHLVSVIERDDLTSIASGVPPMPPGYFESDARITAQQLRARATSGVDGDATARIDVLDGVPSHVIANAAQERGASIVVVGTGRHAVLGRFLYGERALEIVRECASPVLVVPPGARPQFAHVLVAVDFSQSGTRAATTALGMVAPGGRLSLVHVKSAVRLSEDAVGWWNDAYELRSREMLSRFAEMLPDVRGTSVDTVLLRGDAVQALLDFARDEHVDLIACGRRRHGFVQRFLAGSVSTALVRRAPCTVLVAPERAEDADNQDASWMTGSYVSRSSGEWSLMLRSFSQRNAGRRVRLHFNGTRAEHAESAESGYLFLLADFDSTGGYVQLVLGEPVTGRSHLTHQLSAARELTFVADSSGADTRLEVDGSAGRCVLEFEGRDH